MKIIYSIMKIIYYIIKIIKNKQVLSRDLGRNLMKKYNKNK